MTKQELSALVAELLQQMTPAPAVKGGEYESTTALFAELKAATGVEIPAPLAALRDAKVRFTASVGKSWEEMLAASEKFVGIK
jgi:hypothetical protein